MKTITKHLRFDFTEDETRQNAKDLARHNQAIVEAELKRKQITSDLKAEEQRIHSEITKLSRWVNDGYDFRAVECRIDFNDPKSGIKSLYRMDTGEFLEQLPMEQHEMQDHLPLEKPDKEGADDQGDGEPEDESDGKRRPY